MYFFFFFFKQKTAYEIVAGDWSSDVCSSDLLAGEQPHVVGPQPDRPAIPEPGERLRGPSAPEDDDPVAETVKPLPGLPLQADAEREQHHHGDRAPGDAQHGEGGAEFLRPQVGEELAPHVSSSLATEHGSPCPFPTRL